MLKMKKRLVKPKVEVNSRVLVMVIGLHPKTL